MALNDALNTVLIDRPDSIAANQFVTGNEYFDKCKNALDREIRPLFDSARFRFKKCDGHNRLEASTIFWLSIKNRREPSPDGVSKGVYIVYLFAPTRSHFYLTLNQGCSRTDMSRTQVSELLESTKDFIRNNVMTPSGFTADNNIDLQSESELAPWYVQGTIFWKRYDANQLPSESVMKEDLMNLLEAYDRYEALIAEENNEPDLTKFKHLLEYFVTHLEYVRTSDVTLPGYDEYLRNLVEDNRFVRSGQGYNGNRIQEQIAQWDTLSKGKVHISVYGPDCTNLGNYLQWECIAQNVRAGWDNSRTKVENLQVVENAKEPDEVLILEKTVSELGLFDGQQPNDALRSFYGEFASLYDRHYEGTGIDEFVKKASDILLKKKNVILQGAPGTGKTYNTTRIAIAVATENANDEDKLKDWVPEKVREKYEELCSEESQIAFVTFHQSMDYENFVRGIKPVVVNGGVKYEVIDGIFLQMCQRAKDNPDKNYVLIIDEINRGNISRIFGELITLIEKDKRLGENNALQVCLPYRKDDETELFGVPRNLYILGTMNTTDRSVGAVDYALRRRFSFVTIEARRDVIENHNFEDGETKDKVLSLFDDIKEFLEDKNTRADMDIKDLMIGHSYFLVDTLEDLQESFEYEIKPLLIEYQKDGVIGLPFEELKAKLNFWRDLLYN